jgi:hypothetical protein
MKRKIQIAVLVLVLLAQVFVFDMVVPVQAASCSDPVQASYQAPCSCGGGWYCSGDLAYVIYYIRVPIIHTCVMSEAVECPYWCLRCECSVPDRCIMPGDLC